MDLVREQFRRQAEHCRRLGSPFTALLLDLAAERLDRSSAVGRAVLGWQGDAGADALALRFAGSLHGLVLSGAAPELARTYPGGRSDSSTLWAQIAEALTVHEAAMLKSLQSPPQTNEVARCGVLLGGFATLAARTGRPLALLEIGASAGLNLHWDAYGYMLGGVSWGPVAPPLRLEPEWRGPAPALGPVKVHSRRGCDQHPIDPGDARDRLRLRAYIWADQVARLARLDAALDHAARQDARVERADAADWVEARLAERSAGATTVLYHSIVWPYLAATTQQRIEAALEAAAAAGQTPLAWLRMEPSADRSQAELLLTSWPGGASQRLAHADYHGRWVHRLEGES
jgi:hypothetical protein